MLWLLDRAQALLQSLLEDSDPPLVHLPEEGASLKAIEREAILLALERSWWVQKNAARLLGISPRVLNFKLQRHGIQRPCDQARRLKARLS